MYYLQVITCLIAVTRMIQILSPFLHLKTWLILTYLALYIIYMVVNNTTYYLAIELWRTDPTSIIIQKWGITLCIWTNFVHCVVGVVASSITVLYLVLRKESPGERQPGRHLRGCVTILLMNVPYLVTIMCVLSIKFFLPAEFSFREILFAWLPFCTSGLNPVMIIVRMRKVGGFVRHKVRAMLRVSEANTASSSAAVLENNAAKYKESGLTVTPRSTPLPRSKMHSSQI